MAEIKNDTLDFGFGRAALTELEEVR